MQAAWRSERVPRLAVMEPVRILEAFGCCMGEAKEHNGANHDSRPINANPFHVPAPLLLTQQLARRS